MASSSQSNPRTHARCSRSASVTATAASAPGRVARGSSSGDLRRARTQRGAYQLRETIGCGGMGVVRRARDQRLGRDVAIKVMRGDSARLRERFRREALITAALQHPGVVPVYEAGRWETGEPYYAMRLIAGRSLRDHIADCTTAGARLALLPHVIAVARTIAYAHSEGVVHRDLKASNVVVGAFGETVVVDWGLAKVTRGPLADSVDDGRTLTAHGEVLGTPEYMPPEQARGREVDERADVYAIGAILYHVLTGRSPFRGASAVEVLEQLLAGPPVPVRQLERRVSPRLAAIVERAMARDPAQRVANAAEVAEALEQYQAECLGGAGLARTRSRRRLAVAAAALCALALALAAHGGDDRARTPVAAAAPTSAAWPSPVRLDVQAARSALDAAARATEPLAALLSVARERHAAPPTSDRDAAVRRSRARRVAAPARASSPRPPARAPARLADFEDALRAKPRAPLSIVVETEPGGGTLFMSNGAYGGTDGTQFARELGTDLEVVCRAAGRRDGRVRIVFDGAARSVRCETVPTAEPALKNPFAAHETANDH